MTLAQAEKMLWAAGFEERHYKCWAHERRLITIGLNGSRQNIRRWWAWVLVPGPGYIGWDAKGTIKALPDFLAAVPNLGAAVRTPEPAAAG